MPQRSGRGGSSFGRATLETWIPITRASPMGTAMCRKRLRKKKAPGIGRSPTKVRLIVTYYFVNWKLLSFVWQIG
jgi:hypothetical protein